VSVCCSKEPIRGNEMRLAVSPVVNHGCEAGRHGKWSLFQLSNKVVNQTAFKIHTLHTYMHTYNMHTYISEQTFLTILIFCFDIFYKQLW